MATSLGSVDGMGSEASTGPRAPSRGWTSLCVAVPAAAVAWGGWSRRWVSDDGMIYVRVVRQLVDGNGPLVNEGERVEAYTSAIWVAVLGLAKVVARPVDVAWLTVVLGLALTVVGVACASTAAVRLAWRRDRSAVLLPFGSVVVAALPPFWDFATSGLETGLTTAWLGGTFLLLVRTAWPASGRPRHVAWVFVAVGLGPLVRPDLAVFSAVFLAVLLVVVAPGWRSGLLLLVAAAAVPAAYQVFRMGYFGLLVPNPALVKEASSGHWRQGGRYLADFLRGYSLGGLLVVVLAADAWWALTAARRRAVREVLVVSAPVVAGVVHAAYVVRVGGDFMYARLLLPSLFAVTMPVSVIGLRLRPSGSVRSLRPEAVLAGAATVVVAGLALRAAVVQPTPVHRWGIVDERGVYVESSGRRNPVTFGHYRNHEFARLVRLFNAQAAGGPLAVDPRRALVMRASLYGLGRFDSVALRDDIDPEMVVGFGSIGIMSVGAGPDVWIVDAFGLADPIGSHQSLERRDRPGHEKFLPPAWWVARFGQPGVQLGSGDPTLQQVADARRALSCGTLREIMETVSEPLTPGRFFRNVVNSPRLTSFRFSGRPERAVASECGRAS